IDGVQLLLGQPPKDALDAPLIDRTDLIDKSEGRFPQAARAGGQLGIQRALSGRRADGHDGHQWVTLIRNDLRVADDYARTRAALLVSARWIQAHERDRSALELHFLTSDQPRPGRQ